MYADGAGDQHQTQALQSSSNLGDAVSRPLISAPYKAMPSLRLNLEQTVIHENGHMATVFWCDGEERRQSASAVQWANDGWRAPRNIPLTPLKLYR